MPYAEQVHIRFEEWMAQQGDRFTSEQRRWLEMIRDHVATSLEIDIDDLTLTPFVEQGGLGKARQVFGDDLGAMLKELNEELAA